MSVPTIGLWHPLARRSITEKPLCTHPANPHRALCKVALSLARRFGHFAPGHLAPRKARFANSERAKNLPGHSCIVGWPFPWPDYRPALIELMIHAALVLWRMQLAR